jgi:hypothetical protein
LKEAYAAEFAATIERAEKQIILARHGRRVLNLLDDTPVIPGDQRTPYAYANEARQILNDAEDDLKDWQPDLEDVPAHGALDSNGVPSSHQHQSSGSVAGTESVAADHTAEGSRISSGASVTTGPVEPSYAPSEAGTTQVV